MVAPEVCLIYPPLSVHEFPHMALPLLKGFLASKGVNNLVVKDFNVEIMGSLIKSRLGKIEDYFTLRGVKLTVPDIERNLSLAWEILSDKEGRGKDEWAFAIINTYLKIAGMNISDVCYSPGSFNEIKAKFAETNLADEDNPIVEYIRKKVHAYLQEYPARIVGISVPFASQIYYALLIGREVKRCLPGTRVILGGPQISLFWKIVTSHKPFRQAYDALVYGDGEWALLEYVRQCQANGRWEMVPNLIYFDESDKLVLTPEKRLTDVRELPAPDFTDLCLDQYAYPKLPYFFARGCYWSKCAFCSYRDVKGYSARPANQIVDHISDMKERYHRRFFHFIDDSVHPNLIKQVACQLVKRNACIKYEAYLRLDPRFTQELCQPIAQSGMRSALFGLESGNPRVLKIMNKGIDLNEAVAVLSHMKQAGVKSVLSCMIGFPTETREEAWDSIAFLQKTKELYSQAFIVHYGLISDIYEHMQDYEITAVDFDNPVRYDDTGFIALGYSYQATCGMSQQEAFAVIKEARQALGIQMFEDCFFS